MLFLTHLVKIATSYSDVCRKFREFWGTLNKYRWWYVEDNPEPSLVKLPMTQGRCRDYPKGVHLSKWKRGTTFNKVDDIVQSYRRL